jgi:beta-N-acetylhexosaminidase
VGIYFDSSSYNAVIYGCSGGVLKSEEKSFFADIRPAGFILFDRNCQNPDQVRRLVYDLLDCIGNPKAPILIDQEGGRVQRLKPPHWRNAPAAAVFKVLAKLDFGLAIEAVRLNAQLIAAELINIGITVNCAPVLDVPRLGSHEIIGDRALGDDFQTVSALGLAAAEGFMSLGVIPVIKHIPGHGRANADSHTDLPVLDTSIGDLKSVDFQPFMSLSHMPWAMTAHVVYNSLDKEMPATNSVVIIEKIIRKSIGFKGVLVSDDLSMKALAGPMKERSRNALSAGCDIVLHCCGEMLEMKEVAQGVSPLTDEAVERISRGNDMLSEIPDWDKALTLARLNKILQLVMT